MEQGQQVDLNQQREWAGEPGTLAIPEEYIRGLRYEIIVFARKGLCLINATCPKSA